MFHNKSRRWGRENHEVSVSVYLGEMSCNRHALFWPFSSFSIHDILVTNNNLVEGRYEKGYDVVWTNIVPSLSNCIINCIGKIKRLYSGFNYKFIGRVIKFTAGNNTKNTINITVSYAHIIDSPAGEVSPFPGSYVNPCLLVHYRLQVREAPRNILSPGKSLSKSVLSNFD